MNALDIFRILDEIAYPVGSVLKYHMRKRLKRDPSGLLEKDPKAFYDLLKEILGLNADAFLIVLSDVLKREYEVGLSGEKLIRALRENDKDYVRYLLDKVRSREQLGPRPRFVFS